MKGLLREPLLHFLLLGAAIFAAYSLLSGRNGGEPGKIVITQGQVESLAATFTRAWQRPPTDQELASLIQDRVREEVYYREAVALGLDRDDTVIRRRLRQKMEFISDDVAAQAEPTDDELSAYLQAHPDAFRVQRQFTFRQVYLNPERRGDNLARDATQLLAQLNRAGSKADISTLGDAFLLEREFTALPGGEVAKLFGDSFAAKLEKLPAGQWQGPVESSYGVHLVYVSERTKGSLPKLAEVREAVHREWSNARRMEGNEAYYQELLKRYVVTIEGPQPVKENGKVAATP